MNPEHNVEEWIVVAEVDWAASCALAPLLPAQPAMQAAVLFHCQQCAEKYLKAVLVQARIAFPKTHDLRALRALLKGSAPALAALTADLEALNPFAVDARYPGLRLDASQVAAVVENAHRVRTACRGVLGLPDSAA